MAINQKDIKLLWGRSGNRCAICRRLLTQSNNTATNTYTLGEQAHIVGEKKEAARGLGALSQEQKNTYHNLILLCPTHHTEIDKNEADWPVEKLHQIKSEHELWVMDSLSESIDLHILAKDVAVAHIVDSAVDLCDLENWKSWTSFALGSNPQWHKDRPGRILEFRQRVLAAIWPEGYEELQRSATTMSILLNNAAQKFMEHSELSDETYRPHKFYSRGGWNENYDSDLHKYRAWLDDCYELIRVSTKAVNWFADVVRRDINPMFFADRGKFIVEEGPLILEKDEAIDLGFRISLLEFTGAEKAELPDSLFET